jgi:protein disulfide-isomerase
MASAIARANRFSRDSSRPRFSPLSVTAFMVRFHCLQGVRPLIGALVALTMLAGCDISVEGTARPVVARPPAAPAARGSGQIVRGNLQFVEGYRKGYAEATAAGKPMLIFFTAAWCTYCHQMAEEAFTHPQVIALSEQFTCVLVDADAEGDVCRQFGVSGYPTIQFVSPRGALLGRVVGKKPGHQLMMAMQAALQNVARRMGEDEASER